jgi:hypothetical protein
MLIVPVFENLFYNYCYRSPTPPFLPNKEPLFIPSFDIEFEAVEDKFDTSFAPVFAGFSNFYNSFFVLPKESLVLLAFSVE